MSAKGFLSEIMALAFPDGSILCSDTLVDLARSTKLYTIYLTPRSGSSWLTDMCINSGTLGAPQEWFNPDWIRTEEESLGCLPPRRLGTLEINAYIRAIVDRYRSQSGVAGIELYPDSAGTRKNPLRISSAAILLRP